jgi:type IV pilus assembly protein PilA
MRRARLPAGFTLVELMIVVVILGVLAAVAIPAFTRYVKRTKTAEAVGNCSRIYQGQVAYYNLSGDRFGSTRFVNQPYFTPDNNPGSARYPANVALWATDPQWSAIGFVIPSAHYYAYNSFATTTGDVGAYFYARAIGDLDGDDTEATYTVRGEVVAGGEVQRFAIDIVRELE